MARGATLLVRLPDPDDEPRFSAATASIVRPFKRAVIALIVPLVLTMPLPLSVARPRLMLPPASIAVCRLLSGWVAAMLTL